MSRRDDKDGVEGDLRRAGFVPVDPSYEEIRAVLSAGAPAYEVREVDEARMQFCVSSEGPPERWWEQSHHLFIRRRYEVARYAPDPVAVSARFVGRADGPGYAEARFEERYKALWTTPWVETLLFLRRRKNIGAAELAEALRRGAGDREWADALLSVAGLGTVASVVEFVRSS